MAAAILAAMTSLVGTSGSPAALALLLAALVLSATLAAATASAATTATATSLAVSTRLATLALLASLTAALGLLSGRLSAAPFARRVGTRRAALSRRLFVHHLIILLSFSRPSTSLRHR